ncbi:MAG: CRISPR-associated protein Cas5 [Spirochaetota bacterium]
MEEFYIHAKAPFAAFRYFQAGNYRSTMPTLPPSVAYGLLLNLATIEMRCQLEAATTQIKPSSRNFTYESEDSIPIFSLAIGDVLPALPGSSYQQLHTYPVGDSSKHLAPATKGAKYHILPTRREFLLNLDIVIAVRSDLPGLQSRIQDGLAGKFNEKRYGLPFAGDNNFLFDSIEVYEEPPVEAFWYSVVQEDEVPESETCRLTVGIDRSNNSNTTAPLFARDLEKSQFPPSNAWVWTPKEVTT